MDSIYLQDHISSSKRVDNNVAKHALQHESLYNCLSPNSHKVCLWFEDNMMKYIYIFSSIEKKSAMDIEPHTLQQYRANKHHFNYTVDRIYIASVK